MQNGSVNNERSAAQSAALRGAALAFASEKPPIGPKPKPKPNTEVGVGNNDVRDVALAAATKVGGARQPSGISTLSVASGEDLRLGYQNTGSSVGGASYAGGSVQNRLNRLSANRLLQPPADGSRSVSFIAATLAASRSPSVSPNPTGQQVEAKKAFPRSPSIRSGSSSSDLVDVTPVPPMKGLIGMFEGNSKERKTLPLKRSSTTATVKRIPRREPSPTSVRQRALSPLRNEPRKPSKPEIRAPKPNLVRPKTEYLPPQPSALDPLLTKRTPSVLSSKPIPIPPNHKSSRTARTLPSPEDDASSEDSFVSASSQHTEPNLSGQKPSFRAALAQQRRLTSTSVTSLPSTTATIDSMANAIVASSLASSRAASPSKNLLNKYPPVPPARKAGRTHIFHHQKDASRTPSPAKQVGMKTTLRKAKSKDSIDEGEKRRAKRSLVKKHPHKHHEGDRKRWRDSITGRERKRYEAVWASNRGLWLGDGESNRVCSLVVKDVWSRSRLHADILEEVYTLVDRSRIGSLEREEFVVGMWLVDQWLRGRKLPTRVGESVWRSVGTGGIKIHAPKVKK